ncbi:hypothetical protein F5B17DRAFT_440469 [Nemania serpens]|nr:hypothetical protein F5B17DRAFT_440469 [Nemania serpens]
MTMTALIPRGLVFNASAQDNSSIVYIPAWIFVCLCPIVVAMRIWARKTTGAGLGADDYAIILSLAFAIATDIVMLNACTHGYGRHVTTLTKDQKYVTSKAFYILQITFKISMYLTKGSILCLYLRIFGSTVQWFRYTCIGLLWYIAGFCISVTLATIFQCDPITAAFDETIEEKTCFDNRSFWYVNAAVSIATDLIILILPVKPVYRLQVPRAQRAAIMFAFGLGAIVVLNSVFRVTTLEIQYRSTDTTYDISSTMWTIIEMSLAIVCACLPPMRSLLVKIFAQLKSTYSRSVAKIRPVKVIRSPRPTNEDEGKWSRMQPGGIKTTTICRRGSGSEIPPLNADGTVNMSIRKTVVFRIEYSDRGDDSEFTEASPV